MTEPKLLTADELSAAVTTAGYTSPISTAMLAGHIAALQQQADAVSYQRDVIAGQLRLCYFHAIRCDHADEESALNAAQHTDLLSVADIMKERLNAGAEAVRVVANLEKAIAIADGPIEFSGPNYPTMQSDGFRVWNCNGLLMGLGLSVATALEQAVAAKETEQG